MLCSYCSTPNPDTNRFCGECGQPLARQQVTVPAEFGKADRRLTREETTISGPSFLGLTDSDNDQTDYLFEDNQPSRSHTGWVVFSFIAIILLAGVGWLEWNAIKTGQIELPWLKSSTSASASSPTGQTETASVTPATSESTTSTQDQKPESGDASDSGSTVSSDSEAMLAAADAPKHTDTTSSDTESDTKATHNAQARIAKNAAERRDKAKATEGSAASKDDSTDEDQDTAAEEDKPEPKAKPVKDTAPAPPDPRQDRMLVTGEKYLYGRGVPQDCNQALIYFRAAAEKENAPAMSHLGAMYASGHCVTRNKVAAYKWFSRASNSEPNNQWISRSLNMLWRDMSPQERASIAR